MSELFPELDAVDEPGPLVSEHGAQVRQRPGNGSVHVEVHARLASEGIVAGDAALARFEAALGLPGRLHRLTRTAADEIEFIIALPRGRMIAASLVPPGRPALRHGRSFGIAYRGSELPALVAKSLLRILARYDGVPFERLLAAVEPDPGDEHMIPADDPSSIFYAYAPATGWRRFFEGTELYRGVCGAHRGEVAIIEHTDIECLYNVAPQHNRLPNFFASPRLDASLSKAEGDPRWQVEDDARRLFTDIRDRDVIMGADRLLDEALLSLGEGPREPSRVFVHSGCLPEVSGDDLDGSAARTQPKLRLPVVVVGNHNDPLAAALSELFAERDIAPGRSLDRHAIALLGLPELEGQAELAPLLESAGIEVLARLLPSLDPETLEACLRAGVLVTYPWHRHAQTTLRVCERLAPARVIDAGAPFGLAGTCRWLRTIGAATGREREVEATLSARLAALEAEWRALAARARRYRLGFVVEHPDWQTALAPERSLGADMPALLREMGFGVDILVHRRPGAPKPQTARGSGVEPRVRSYGSREELAEWLADPGVVAWYSELRHDRRLTRLGNNPFSLQQFRMGLGGALASLRELVELAELPFFRRYAEYLGPAFAPARMAGETEGER